MNKEKEEIKVSEIYDQIIAYLVNNRNISLSKIEEYFNQNTKCISNKLDYFAKNIENGEKIKEELIEMNNQASSNLNQVHCYYHTRIVVYYFHK